MMLIALISGVVFNLSHSFLNIDMLKNEYNRQVLLLPYYFVTIFIFLLILILKNLKQKISFSFMLFVISFFFLVFIFERTEDFAHVKRVFINLSPFLFYFSLIFERKDYSDSLYKIIMFTFFICILFSVYQLILGNSIHEGRINGIFQGPNSYAMFLLGCLLVFFVNKNLILISVCVLLIFFTKSSSAILILLCFVFLYYFNVKTFIISVLTISSSLFTFFYVYTEGSNQMLDKILFIYEYFSTLTFDDLKYLSYYDSAFYIPNVSNEVISPLNRIVQFNYYIFNTTWLEFLGGAYKPRFYESLLLILLSNFGLFAICLLISFFYITIRRLNVKSSKCLFYSMIFFSFLALPVFSMSFSSWFVMASLYVSIRLSQSEARGVKLEKV